MTHRRAVGWWGVVVVVGGGGSGFQYNSADVSGVDEWVSKNHVID